MKKKDKEQAAAAKRQWIISQCGDEWHKYTPKQQHRILIRVRDCPKEYYKFIAKEDRK